MVPQKAALNKIYTRTRKNNKHNNHTKKHTKRSGKETSSGKANRRKWRRHEKSDTQQKHTSNTKSGRKDWMKTISNYLEEGIGAGAQKQTKKRTFPFRECKTKMADRQTAAPFCTGARISEKRERGWSTPALESGKNANRKDKTQTRQPPFLIVC